jgi:hypothetical protein
MQNVMQALYLTRNARGLPASARRYKRYLVDEIYARTIKMERERRYCIRYLRPYCSLERIVVEIVITKDVFDEERISYTLEEKGYPVAPFSSIKDVSTDILSGEELVAKLEGGK